MTYYKKNFIDIINIELFKSDISGFETYYESSDETERYIIKWYDSNNKKYVSINYCDRMPVYYFWLSFFGYNKYPDEEIMQNKLNDFYMDCFDIEDIENLLIENVIEVNSKVETLLVKKIERYIQYALYHPYYLTYFTYLFDLVHNMFSLSEIDDIQKEVQRMKELSLNAKEIIEQFKGSYILMKDYIYWTLIFNLEKGKAISPIVGSKRHKHFLNITGKVDIFDKYLYLFDFSEAQGSEFLEIISEEKYFEINEENFDSIDEIVNYEIWGCIGDTSYANEFSYNLNELIEDEFILSKCPNCKRYFLKKYFSNTKYCSYEYGKSKSNCQAYAARVKYQNKLKKNPIQAEYYLVRNRMYIRAKRGSISEQSAKLEELKEIRDKYLSIYKDVSSEEQKRLLSSFKKDLELLYK